MSAYSFCLIYILTLSVCISATSTASTSATTDPTTNNNDTVSNTTDSNNTATTSTISTTSESTKTQSATTLSPSNPLTTNTAKQTPAPDAGPSTTESYTNLTSSDVSTASGSETAEKSSAPTTTETTPATTTHPPLMCTPGQAKISETNLLLVNQSPFVELSAPNCTNLMGLTLAIFNSSSSSLLFNQTFNESNSPLPDGYYFVITLNASMFESLSSAIMTLYLTANYSAKFSQVGLLDFLAYSFGPVELDTTINKMLQNNSVPSMFVNRTYLVNVGSKSLSRCQQDGNSESFIVSKSSMNMTNYCNFSLGNSVMIHVQNVTGCPKNKELFSAIVTEINRNCLCGMNLPNLNIIKPFCCGIGSPILNIPVQTIDAEQGGTILKVYLNHTNSTIRITGDDQSKNISVNQQQQCPTEPRPTPNNDGGHNVTVAVVLTCLVVFLLVFAALVIYMRRRRRNTMQFRMTRLTEDDDEGMGDMEDFVGNGPETS